MNKTRLVASFIGLSLLTLSGCIATLGKPSWLPTVLVDDQPYLAQLEPGKYSAGLKAQGIETDVREEQSTGLGLVALPELEALLNNELQAVKNAIGFPEFPGKVYILASPTMNAMATADGNIYIPLGMIMDIDSTDEMVALLGHELAHSLLNHTDTDLLVEIQKKGTTAWVTFNQFSEAAGSDLTRRARNAMTFAVASDRLLHPTWNRQQELAADKISMDILVKTQRDPNALLVLLQRLHQWELKNKKEQERTSILVSAAVAKYAKEDWQASLMEVMAPVGLTLEDQVNTLSHTHLSPDQRLEAARDYLRAHYRRVTRTPAETREWAKIAHSPAAKRQAESVDLAHTAYNEIVAGKLNEAEKTLKRIPRREGERQNYYLMLQAMLAEERGQTSQVLALTEVSKNLTYPSYRLQILRARSQRDFTSPTGLAALQNLYAEFDSYGRPPAFYPDLISLATQSGNTPFRLEVLLHCYAANFGQTRACSADAAKAEDATSSASAMGQLLGAFGRFK